MSEANPVRGEAKLGEHLLTVDFNGLCVLESVMEKKVPDILTLMKEGMGFSDLRACVYVFGSLPTPEAAGELIAEAGVTEALLAVTAATAGFFAPRKDKTERPLKAV